MLRRAVPHAERRTTWLELGFDLVFVVTVTELADRFAEMPGAEDLSRLALLFLTVFLTWSETTRAVNLLEGDDLPRRLVILVQILAFSAAAVFVGEAWERHTTEFALALAVGRAAVVVEFARAARHIPGGVRVLRIEGAAAAVGVALDVVAAVTDTEWLLPVAALTVLVGPLFRLAPGVSELLPAHPSHLAERFGLFTVIVLGDAHGEVVAAVSGRGVGVAGLVEAAAILLVTAAIWWGYFRGIDDSSVETGGAATIVWLGVQLLLTGAVAAFGGIARRVVDSDATAAADLMVLWTSVGVALLALAAVHRLRRPVQSRQALRLALAGGVAAVAGGAVAAAAAARPEWSVRWALPVLVAHAWLAVR